MPDVATDPTNMDSMKKMLKDAGYAAHVEILDAREFFLPQSRRRYYIIAFPVELTTLGSPTVQRSLHTVKTTLQALRVPATPLQNLLLDDADPLIARELTRLLAVREATQSYHLLHTVLLPWPTLPYPTPSYPILPCPDPPYPTRSYLTPPHPARANAYWVTTVHTCPNYF